MLLPPTLRPGEGFLLNTLVCLTGLLVLLWGEFLLLWGEFLLLWGEFLLLAPRLLPTGELFLLLFLLLAAPPPRPRPVSSRPPWKPPGPLLLQDRSWSPS